ncbi:MAG: ATP-binding cassette domain-containing protein, partial [Pseudomonadota bacterium]
MIETRLQFDRVSRYFPPTKAKGDGVLAIEDVNVTVKDGEVVSLIGPSGCGKSTLLNLGSGLDRPTTGKIFVDGEEVDGPNEHVAFMLQKDLLLPWRTIRQNVEFGQ